jgi:hypothetical protein
MGPGASHGYSVGFALPATTAELLERIPAVVWAPAYDGRRRHPRRRLGGRAHRSARPQRLANGDAGDRAQGAAAPGRAATDHRCRRDAGHRVRHQHHPRPTGRPGSARDEAREGPRTGCGSKDLPRLQASVCTGHVGRSLARATAPESGSRPGRHRVVRRRSVKGAESVSARHARDSAAASKRSGRRGVLPTASMT